MITKNYCMNNKKKILIKNKKFQTKKSKIIQNKNWFNKLIF